MVPLLHVPHNAKARYETPTGEKNYKADFLFEHGTLSVPIMLDVKSRIVGLIGHTDAFAANFNRGDATAPIEAQPVERLFRSLVTKFPESPFTIRLQGGWIRPNLRYRESELVDFFNSTNPQRLHFVIFVEGEQNAYVLARNETIKSVIYDFFGLAPGGVLIAS